MFLVDGVEAGESVKEVKHESQGLGLVIWVNHDAIYQEAKGTGGGRTGTSHESKSQKGHCGCGSV